MRRLLRPFFNAAGIFAVRPSRHVDIGSRIDGFVAHVLTFMPVTIVDIIEHVGLGRYGDPASPAAFANVRNACGLFEFTKP